MFCSKVMKRGWWLLLFLLLALPLPVWAGGWVTVTLDEWPAQVVANEEVTIGFVVRQHGQHPATGLSNRITAVHVDTGESFTITATEQGEPGHYVASLTFPRPGAWRWTINGFGERPLPDLIVQASATVVANAAQTSTPVIPLSSTALVVIGLSTAIGALFFWLRTRTRWALTLALTLALTGIVIAGAGFMLRPNEPETVVAQTAAVQASAEIGEILFVAKGCVTCHQHRGLSHTGSWTVSIGPDLTNYEASPEFLHLWLQDPPAVKPQTVMPNLQLKQHEIESLIAFLSTQ